MQLQELIAANQQTLTDAEEILLALPDTAYTEVTSPFTAALGKHMRHITDHYEQFFEGLGKKRIDYDGRERDESAEKKRSVMILLIRTINAQLSELANQADCQLNVVLSIDENAATPEVPSTLSRELLFLQSHATHHFAIISAILRMQGIQVSEDFGIAPSTLKYEHQKCVH